MRTTGGNVSWQFSHVPPLGEPLKKTAAVLAAAALLLTGCTPQLSTSETCVELRAAMALAKDGVWTVPPHVQAEYLAAMDKVAARSSDTLKDVIRDVTEANRERAKPTREQDAAKIAAIQARIDPKSDMLIETCHLPTS